MNDRIGYLLGRLTSGTALTAAEHSECLRLGIRPGPPIPRPRSRYDFAKATGCSDRTYRSIFG